MTQDLVVDLLKLKLGHSHTVGYRLEIDDVNKLSLRRYQCEMPTTIFDETQHRQAIKTKCLAKCMDKHYYQDLCNCTTLNAFNSGVELPDCLNIFPDTLWHGTE